MKSQKKQLILQTSALFIVVVIYISMVSSDTNSDTGLIIAESVGFLLPLFLIGATIAYLSSRKKFTWLKATKYTFFILAFLLLVEVLGKL